MEKELSKRFIDTRKEEKRINRQWYNTQAKRIKSDTYPEHTETFKMPARWFAWFFRRNKTSLRRKTDDENIIKSWVSEDYEDWGNHFLDPATPGFTGKTLFADNTQSSGN